MDQSTLVGETLGGRYQIQALIGQGGMATVYKARDPNLNRAVAVKTIKPQFATDPKFLGRFESEAMAVAKLRHSNIVQVFDYSHDNGLYYMVQEFVAGETLQDRLQRLNEAGRVLPVEEAIRYTLDLCQALGYAHQRGIIHRDVKPANVMLDVHGQAILMDFGIVKITGSTQHTMTGAVVGTALYMPPELIQGGVPDARSDIYSLGVTLYEMVSGQPPFTADSAMTVMMMHVQDPVPDACQVRPDVPEPLCDIVTRALAKDREMRYDSTAAMAADLRHLLEQLEGGAALHFQATQLDEPLAVGPRPEKTVAETPVAATGGSLPGQFELRSFTQPDVAPPSARKVETPALDHSPAEGFAPARPPAARAARPAERAAQDRSPLPGWPIQRWLKVGGLALLGVAILALALVLLLGGSGEDSKGEPGVAGVATETETVVATPRDEATAVGAGAVATPTIPSSAPALTPTQVLPPEPTLAPAPTPEPIAISIAGIGLDAEDHYVVDYQALGLPEMMTNTHLHFFFNTVSFEAAGAPAESAWIRYFGPSPFGDYTAADRPENASQLCVQAANPNHTPILGTGDCAVLPDVVTVTSDQDLVCLFGPGEEYPAVGELPAGELALVRGLSFNELWWNVANPSNLNEVCWLSTLDTQVSGDISQLPLVEGPPAGAEPTRPLAVEITEITIDAENHYVVDHVTEGFTSTLPGTHLHFYFNVFAPEDVGIGGQGERRVYGGPSPYRGFVTDDRPAGASEMCAVVANPDHSVVANSEYCSPLPNLPAVEITQITEDAEAHYAVDYQVQDFVPEYPGGYHLHFYFNVFAPEDVGIGGDANRRPYGGSPPFTGYALADRPPEATQLCAIVANPDHSILPNSGSCATLPGLPTVQITGIAVDEAGQYQADYVISEFTPEYPGGYHLHFFFNVFSPEDVGIGGEANRRPYAGPPPFAGYATIDRPEGATQLCAVVANPDHSVRPNSGNCLPLPDVLAVQITDITIDAQYRYVVEYETSGFAPRSPGTHVHFYFDTVSPEELTASNGSTNYSHGGQSPYTGYSTADRPPEAMKLCAIVAQSDNSVVVGSGNCFALPDVVWP
jgi:serine/threonine-protein kinase